MDFVTMSKAEMPSNSFLQHNLAPQNRKPFDFQLAGVEYMSKKRFVLDADEPGLGKSMQAVLLANLERPNTICVICPASLIPNWKNEFAMWLNYSPRIFFYSYNKPPAKDLKFDYLILDECHYLKNFESKRTQAILNKDGIIRRVGRAVALSGTPFLNYPIEIFPIASVFNPKSVKELGQIAFGIRYCRGYQDNWGSWVFKNSSNEDELQQLLREHLMVRRLKKDVLKQLPELRTRLVELEPDEETAGIITLYNAFEPEVISGKYEQSYKGLATIRRELGIRKIKKGAEYLRLMNWTGYDKMVIFCHHKEVVYLLAQELNCPFIIGGQKPELKQTIVDEFYKSDNPFLVVSIMAGGVGLNMTCANYVCIFEPYWSPSINYQAIDRINRIGQMRGMIADILFFKNSLDERILKLHFHKNQIFRSILNAS